MFCSRLSCIAVCTYICFCTSPYAHALDLTVTNTNDSGPGSLRDAIEQVAAVPDVRHKITITATGTMTLLSPLTIFDRNVVICGPGQDQLTISGGNASTIFDITSTTASIVFIKEMTISDSEGAISAIAILGGAGSETAILSGILFSSNSTTGSGGAFTAVGGNVTVRRCVFNNNNADEDGASIHVGEGSQVIVRKSDFMGGTAGGNGGECAVDAGASLALLGCTASGSDAPSGSGGFVSNDGSLFVADTDIDMCSARFGGGIRIGSTGDATIRRTTIRNCAGSGIENLGVTDIVNSTISGCADGAQAGGIDNGFGSLRLMFVTPTDNRVNCCGVGGNRNFAPVEYYSCINAGNTVGGSFGGTPDIQVDTFSGGSVLSWGWNVIGADDTGFFTLAGDQTGSAAAPLDPMLGPLQDNGGFSFTHDLLPGSPALDAGCDEINSIPRVPYTFADGSVLALDQRRFIRPIFNTTLLSPDAGSLESGLDGSSALAEVDWILDRDANDDFQISRFESGLTDLLFGSADTNSDGLLDDAEIKAMLNPSEADVDDTAGGNPPAVGAPPAVPTATCTDFSCGGTEILSGDGHLADSVCAFPRRVYLHNGEEHFERVDLAIPGRGDIHFVMSRGYRSQLDYDGPLGFGWDFNYNERLYPQENGDVVRANGRSHLDRWVRKIVEQKETKTVTEAETETFDNVALPEGWVTSGASAWSTVSKGAGRVLQSPDLEDDESSTLEFTLEVGSGEIQFDYGVSSEGGYDTLRLYLNDEEQGEWSGEEEGRVTIPVTAGSVRVRLVYAKDSSESSGDDQAWIDNITYPVVTTSTTTTTAGDGFTAPTGFFRSLVQQADGGYVTRSPNGFKRYYSAEGRLEGYEDRHGNTMGFEYDAAGRLNRVIDAYGRVIDYTFEIFADGVARLVRITDFMGRQVLYSYDEQGDLVAVRTPVVEGTSTGNDFPEGRTERYTYSTGFDDARLNHNLLSVTYPEEVARGGPAALTWTYGEDPSDQLNLDRVQVLSMGGGRSNASGVAAGGDTTFQYEMLDTNPPPVALQVPRGKVTLTRRNGNVLEYFANELGHHILTRIPTKGLRADEPAYYETRSFFDQDGQLIRRIFPEGNELRRRYDTGTRGGERDVVEIRRIADPARGGGADLVTTLTYEPLFRRVASVTGPRGHAPDFAPPLGVASAQRYTTRLFYDYQEGSAPIADAATYGIDLSTVARGLGDLNDDGRIDQNAGNVVRSEAPAVTLLADSREAERLGTTTQPIWTQTQWNDRGQLIANIDAEGNVNELAYYPENDPDGDGVPVANPGIPLGSAARGYLQSRTVDSRTSARRSATMPPAMLKTDYAYDPVGNLIATVNPRGIRSDIEVNALNEAVVITRGADVGAALATGQLLEDAAPLAYRTRLTRDFNGRLIRSERANRDSNTEGVGDWIDRTWTYDLLDNPVQSTVEVDADVILVSQQAYDPSELPTTSTQPEGNQTHISYDERNLPLSVTRGYGSPDASIVQIDYDLNANRHLLIDAEDNDGDGQPEVTTWTYDGFDRVIGVTDALGNEVVNAYDPASALVRSQVFGQPAGQPHGANVLLREAFYRRDELNRVYQTDHSLFLAEGFNPVRAVDLQDENADGLVTTRREYDALSRSTYTWEDDNEISKIMYDGVSRVVMAADALGNRLERDYDQNSNPVQTRSIEISAEGLVPDEHFTTSYVYDQLDRLVRATDNAGQTSRFAYDSRDNLVSRSDPEGAPMADPLGLFPGQINGTGNTKTYFYDGLDRVLSQVCDLRVGGRGAGALDLNNAHNPDGQVSLSYDFDGNSRLTGIVDDNGNRTSYGYDTLNRRVEQINAKTDEITTWAFDRDDNIRTVTDPEGTVIAKTFDALNRLSTTSVTRAAGVGGTTAETFSYDGLSRLTQATDDNGGPAQSQSYAYTYDSLSRVLEERFNGEPVSSVYTGDSKRLQCVYPGGRIIQQTFDLIDRVKEISDNSTGTPRLVAASDWIGPGLRELQRRNGNGTTLSFLGEDGTSTYDAVKRITRLTVTGPGGTVLDREYGYNRANMRTFERRNDDAALTDRYTYDSMYRVTSTVLDLGGGGTARDLRAIGYVYDGVGNRREVKKTTTSAGTTAENYSVNAVNEYTSKDGTARVHSLNGNLRDDGQFQYRYDYKNRLINVAEAGNGDPVAAYLYYADNRRAKKTVFTAPGGQEDTEFFYDGWRVCEERSSASGTTTFVYNPVYIDEPVQLQNAAGTFTLHQNARADVVAVTDAAGAVVERRYYDDFGRAFDASKQPVLASVVGNPYGFQGRRLDAETGLYYFRNRYYSPETGRFLQRDPVWDGGNVGNQHSFVTNGPVSRRDPSGLQESSSSTVGDAAKAAGRKVRGRLKTTGMKELATEIVTEGAPGALGRTGTKILKGMSKSVSGRGTAAGGIIGIGTQFLSPEGVEMTRGGIQICQSAERHKKIQEKLGYKEDQIQRGGYFTPTATGKKLAASQAKKGKQQSKKTPSLFQTFLNFVYNTPGYVGE